MPPQSTETVFVDSSIQISKTIREPDMEERIRAWLAKYGRRVSSTVPLQEFKRRVLRELPYLLAKLEQTRSYQKALAQISNVLPAAQLRKQRICVPLLHKILPGATDQDLTERGRRYFRTLLMNGESDFVSEFDAVLPGVDCFLATTPVAIEKQRYKRYQLGNIQCSKTKKQCRIGEALTQILPQCKSLYHFLASLPPERLTSELETAREFLNRIVNGPGLEKIHDEDACLKVGDLLIALESASIENFYTMNYRESQAFCDFLNQNLTVRPNNPLSDEITHARTAKPWPLLR
jgi:predicted nucleic acid-binding protein